MKSWSLFPKKRAHTPQPDAKRVDPKVALEDAKKRLMAWHGGDERAAATALGFAQALLSAVGEDPAKLENQIVAHHMAIEQARIARDPARLN